MNSFDSRARLTVSGKTYEYWSLPELCKHFEITHLPFSIKILLENLLRTEDGVTVTRKDIETLARWSPKEASEREIAFTPSRVLMQDFTGVPAIVDLAAMRAAMQKMGGDPSRINPLSPVDLVIDHSVQVDQFASKDAFVFNTRLEHERNRERYQFLRWGQKAFANFRVVPPGTGIVHQVNLEYLARVVFTRETDGTTLLYPDTLVGTDSHTTMINGLGVLGWGVGGIEAEAAMLGLPVSMRIPQVVGFRLKGRLPEGTTATDLVLIVTQMLRRKGVVEKFVEFFGDGLDELSLADRATIANMAPEYGATCGLFPIDSETVRYLRLTGRSEELVTLVENYARAQGFFRDSSSPDAHYSDTLELDLAEVVPSLAGPKRPQDRVTLSEVQSSFHSAMTPGKAGTATLKKPAASAKAGDDLGPVRHGSVVIAAITSCTNTSNPAVMIGAGLLARKARAKGLKTQPWVKTSLAPGSRVVTEYLNRTGLMTDLEAMGFHLVGYGCTTCIGNSGPLPEPVATAIKESGLSVAAVLSGNRNFEGRVHPLVKLNYLCSPPLVVAYAIAGTIDVDLTRDALGRDPKGNPVHLRDIWPSQREIHEAMACIASEMFRQIYFDVFKGDEPWRDLSIPEGKLYSFDARSTYIKMPPYFEEMKEVRDRVGDLVNARVLAVLGDSVTTDHISPAGSIAPDSPAGRYLAERGVAEAEFNQYGARRGNHELMMRGTFANIRLRNHLVPGVEGGFTLHLPDEQQMTIFEASERYRIERVPLIVLAGKEYGSGSSRDWAAKGPMLLGIRAVIAESFERIHRSNLIGMGILPLQFKAGENVLSLGLTGRESYSVEGLRDAAAREASVTAAAEDGSKKTFSALMRLDTPKEVEYFRHGGILNYVLRRTA